VALCPAGMVTGTLGITDTVGESSALTLREAPWLHHTVPTATTATIARTANAVHAHPGTLAYCAVPAVVNDAPLGREETAVSRRRAIQLSPSK
jgi:hypothetical protein